MTKLRSGPHHLEADHNDQIWMLIIFGLNGSKVESIHTFTALIPSLFILTVTAIFSDKSFSPVSQTRRCNFDFSIFTSNFYVQHDWFFSFTNDTISSSNWHLIFSGSKMIFHKLNSSNWFDDISNWCSKMIFHKLWLVSRVFFLSFSSS